MSDERLELPLFDPPERESRKELDALFSDTPAQDRSQPTDEPVVVEPIELPPTTEPIEEATTGPIPDLDPQPNPQPNPQPSPPPSPPPNPDPGLDPASEAPTEDLSPAMPKPAGVGARLAGGLIDLLVHVALAGILIGGSSLLDAPVGLRHALPLGFAAAIFSFVYHVVPLAFWGRTPGMAVAGLRARTLEDEPLSLPQATKHWLALLLTVATAGLGVLLALGGRSLADRLSRSQTLQE